MIDQRTIEEINLLLVQESYEDAIALLEEFIEENPDKLTYYWYLGLAYLLQEKAEEISNKFIEFFKTDSQEIKTQIETYHGLLLNFKNVVDLYLKYKTENVELVKNLKQESSDILTNERKTYYEDQKIY